MIAWHREGLVKLHGRIKKPNRDRPTDREVVARGCCETSTAKREREKRREEKRREEKRREEKRREEKRREEKRREEREEKRKEKERNRERENTIQAPTTDVQMYTILQSRHA